MEYYRRNQICGMRVRTGTQSARALTSQTEFWNNGGLDVAGGPTHDHKQHTYNCRTRLRLFVFTLKNCSSNWAAIAQSV